MEMPADSEMAREHKAGRKAEITDAERWEQRSLESG